jgi:hypothetical protein
MKLILLTLATTLLAYSAFAGDCTLQIDRKPCPGKEAEAIKPYDGKNPTEEKIAKATTSEACAKEGAKAAKIVRKGVLAQKTVKITFDGKPLEDKTESKECK